MQLLKRHWRILIPLALMLIVFLFSNDPASASDAKSLPFAHFFGLSNAVVRKLAHCVLFASLGASWYYYFRHLNKFTPGFTFLASLAFTALYALIDEFHQTFTPGRAGLFSDVLIDTLAAFTSITIFATLYYLTRTAEQKAHRKTQIRKLWQNNAKLIKKIQKK